MTNFCVIDLETSIGTGVHTSAAKDPNNDFYTVIAGTTPNNVQVWHEIGGFKRQFPAEAAEMINNADVLVLHNAPFDLSYLWKTKELRDFLLRGGQVWDCFPPDVEILTEFGFVKFGDLVQGERVAQYSPDGTIELVYPLGYINKPYHGELLALSKGRYINHLSTPTHNRVLRTFKHKKLRVVPANSKTSLFSHHNTILSGIHDTTSQVYGDSELKFMVAIQADAHICKRTKTINFEFTKQRKIDRLLEILQDLKLEYKVYNYRNAIIHVKNAFQYIGPSLNKQLCLIDPFMLPLRQKQLIIDEIQYWDGTKTSVNCIEFYNTNQQAIDKYQIIASLSGCRTHRTDNRLSIVINKDYTCQQGMVTEAVNYDGTVHCVTVPSGMIVIRYQGCVQISGNCQVAEYIMSGQRHSFASLAELQNIYLGQKIKEHRISALFKAGVGADKIVAASIRCKRLFSLYVNYSCSDGVTTLQVFQKQYAKAKQLNMLEAVKLYNWYMLALVQVMNTGIPVDLDKCETTLRDFKIKSMQYLQEATKLVEPLWDERLGPFNINSNKDKSAILFGGTFQIKKRVPDGKYKNGNDKFRTDLEDVHINGFKLPLSLTESGKTQGQYKTGADIVEKIYRESKNEQAKEYCRLQKLAMNYGKMCSTYLEPFLKLSVEGLLYPNFNNTMTITSRLSSSKPNLQNVPSHGEMLGHIQGQFVAPKGWKCVSCDYSQLEVYVAAYLANDYQLTKDLLDGVDFHVKRLSYAEDLPYEEVYARCKIKKLAGWDAKRTAAKTISYQKAYGASPKSLAKSTGIDESVIKTIFEREDLEYPGVAAFNKAVMEQVNNNKELSLAKHIPESKKGNGKDSKKFIAGMELLPIISGDIIRFDRDEYRNIGYYRCVTGKRYVFEEIGRIDFKGNLKRGFSTTQTKNYQIQGTASDVQAASSAALLPLLLKHSDKIKMVNEIHDSKWFLVKEEYLSQMIPIIRDIMEDVPKNFKKFLNVEMPFRIPVDVEVGDNFAETESYSAETPIKS